MMTKEQHIGYWINSAEEDWLSVAALQDRKRYLHCLFWAHLMLEKLAKAIWVKYHEENLPPKIHNITWLLSNSNINLGKDRMAFVANFNEFQLSGRYPDYLNKIHAVCTESFTISELAKAKEIRTCLLEILQSK
ncbi:MAG: HEPN domain-containing protein [Prevotellaceae bacterium]|jgi:HEPN domain-containing protein|nr:HEPN domain-containing protein [Prevotellaceae bacterium]